PGGGRQACRPGCLAPRTTFVPIATTAPTGSVRRRRRPTPRRVLRSVSRTAEDDLTAPVIVVGGGIVGCSTAYELAKEGVPVTLLEQQEVAFGASGRNPGFVWLHCRNPGFALEVSLAARRRYP